MRTRVLQVGAGGFGETWLRALTTLRDDFELIALVDKRPEVLAAAAETMGVPPEARFIDVEAALDVTAADIALVIVPPDAHRPVATACLEAGLPVLVEKPLAGRWADCLALTEAADRAGRELAVSQNFRYRPLIETARRLLASGRLGAIGQVQIDFRLHYDFRGDFRETMDHPLILEMAVHHFDLIRWITGLEAVSVAAHTWNPPWSQFSGDASASCVFAMDGGARVVYNGTWHPRGQLTDWNGIWRIECERGYLVLSWDTLRVYEGDDPHRAGSRDDERVEPLVELPYVDQAAVLVDVAEAVRSGRPAATTARDNLRSIEMVFAAVEAAESGAPVALDGVRDARSATG